MIEMAEEYKNGRDMVEAGDAYFWAGEENFFRNFPEQVVHILGILRK
jgi:hypothetical protein